MKKLVKKIGKNKFQFIFFVGILAFVLVALVIASSTGKPDNETPVVDDLPLEEPDDTVSTDVEEAITLPFAQDLDYTVTRLFYEKTSSSSEQEKALIKYGTTYRTSDGVAYARKDNQSFDVLAVLSGKVVEVKNNPLYGTYVVIEHDNDLKTYYYGLQNVEVTEGVEVQQGTKLGVSGTTEIDQEAGNHVFLKIQKNDKKLNPESLIGKKISEIK